MEKYGQALINSTTKLDEITGSDGELIKYAHLIIEENSKSATIDLLKRLSTIIDSIKLEHQHKGNDIINLANVVKSNLIEFYGYSTIQSICRPDITITEDKRTLENLIEELNELVGLEKVKCQVNDLIAYQKVQKLRDTIGLHSTKNTLHLAFTGNPGTGKTTVARIVGRIYKKIGLLSKGHFIEVSRTDLIAGYQGQTALKVKKVIEQAKGGVLFIDEAYSITENDHSDSYGRECLTELTKALEDYRDDLVVIVAGYTEPMKKFFESNPGLRSRFNTFIEFDDYSSAEMEQILLSMCKKNDYSIDDKAKEEIHFFFDRLLSEKTDNFANGRLVRNLYDDLVMNHAKRVVKILNPTRTDLSVIIDEDFTNDIAERLLHIE